MAAVPQELQDEILRYLLKLHLQVGTILLDREGRGTVHDVWEDDQVEDDQVGIDQVGNDRVEGNPKPLSLTSSHPSFNLPSRLSIMQALNRHWFQRAKKILYCDNVWRISLSTTLDMSSPFFTQWYLEDLRLLPRVMLVGYRHLFTPWRREPAGELFMRLEKEHTRCNTCGDTLYESSPKALSVWSYRSLSLADVSRPFDDNGRLYTLPDPPEGVETLQKLFPLTDTLFPAPRRILERPAQAQKIILMDGIRADLEKRMREIPDSCYGSPHIKWHEDSSAKWYGFYD